MAKRRRLVRQHFEKISAEMLEDFRNVVRPYIKGKRGIYALYEGENLCYIGLATELQRRLRRHLKDRHRGLWDRFSVYVTSGGRHLKELESLLLRVTEPPGNGQKAKLPGSHNLKPDLSRNWKAFWWEKGIKVIGSVRKTKGKPRRKKRQRKSQRPGGGREPGLASYTGKNALAVTPGAWAMLKANYKGKKLKAFVRRDGMIRYDGERFATPSGAARAVCKKRCNGWRFWKYKNAAGEWVVLNELRKASKRHRP